MFDITGVVVDRRAEAGFRRRALRAMPNEHLETIYGRVRGTIAYIYAFVPFEHDAHPATIDYDEQDMLNEEDEARKEGYVLLGTIHTHPDLDHTMFSQGDAVTAERDGESLFGICAIDTSGKRRKTQITYWPGIKHLPVKYTGKENVILTNSPEISFRNCI